MKTLDSLIEDFENSTGSLDLAVIDFLYNEETLHKLLANATPEQRKYMSSKFTELANIGGFNLKYFSDKYKEEMESFMKSFTFRQNDEGNFALHKK